MPPLQMTPQKTRTQEIVFSTEPALNVVHSLYTLAMSALGLYEDEWTLRIKSRMTPEDTERLKIVMVGLFYTIFPEESYPSFESYLRSLRETDGRVLVDRMLSAYLKKETIVGQESSARFIILAEDNFRRMVPDFDTYIEFLTSRYKRENVIFEDIEEKAFYYVHHSGELGALLIPFFESFWNRFLKAEWDREEPRMLLASRELQKIDFSGKSTEEIFRLVTGETDASAFNSDCASKTEHIVFVPSMHIDKHVFYSPDSLSMYIFFSPDRVNPTLLGMDWADESSKGELERKFSALADGNRLKILRLIARFGEQSSGDIMERLSMNQSTTSRSCSQLVNAGYLKERRKEYSKCYTLNYEGIRKNIDQFLSYIGRS